MPLKGLRLYTLMINLTLLDARSNICLSRSDLGKNTERIMELLIKSLNVKLSWLPSF